MASTYSPLKVELIGTGEQAGTWGDTTNANLGTALEEAIVGSADVTFASADVTVTLTNTNSTQIARHLRLNLVGTSSGAHNLILGSGCQIEKPYLINNTLSHAITVKNTAGTGIAVPAGKTMWVYNNGTNVVDAVTHLSSLTLSTALPIASGGTGTTSTTFVNLASNVTGTLPIANGGTGTTSTTFVNLASNVTGTLPIANGGTGATTLTANAALIGNGTSAISTLAPGSSGNVMTSNGTAWTSTAPTNSFSTLVVGTQTNKATISYTTNTARTITIPAVAGDRTFAFINEAQTFSAAQTYTANQTVQADLILSGNGRKLQGNFIPYDNDATLFQNTVTNQGTALGIIPNGIADNTSITFYGKTDTEDTNFGGIYFSGGYQTSPGFNIYTATLNSDPVPQISFNTSNFQRMIISASGDISINTSTDTDVSLKVGTGGSRTYSIEANGKLKFTSVYANTVGATNRTMYIDDTGVIGGLSSTRESKKNIAPIEDASWLMSLEPVSYNRRLRSTKGVYTEEVNPVTEYGLIADDVANVRPEICVFVDGKVSGISYEQLIAPMLKEIQTLRAEVNALKEKLSG